MLKMSDHQLLLSWNGHNGALVSVFENLLKKNALVDCTLAAEGQYLKAHKVVLSACSPYFELLFCQESEKNPIVILKDVKFQELEAAVNFMYRGEVKVHKDRLSAFLEVADSLQITGLATSGMFQNSKENDSSVKCQSAKSPLTERDLRKEESNIRSDNANKNSIVPADGEHTRNNDISAACQSSSVISPAVTVSTSTVGKETCRDSVDVEYIGQSLAVPPDTSGEIIHCEENLIIKTESVPDTFLEVREGQPHEAVRDLEVDVTLTDGQNDRNEHNMETMDVASTNHQDMDAGLIHSEDQQNFLTVLEKVELNTSASRDKETISYGVSSSSDTAQNRAGTISTSTGVDNLVEEDAELRTPASVPSHSPVAGARQRRVSRRQKIASLERTSRPVSKKYCCSVCKEAFVRIIDIKKHMRSKRCGALPSFQKDNSLPVEPSEAQPLKIEISDPMSLSNNFFKCSECNYVSSKRSIFKRHFSIHSKDKPFKCPVCDYAFGLRGEMKSHLHTHNEGRPFKCPHCDYAAKFKPNLLNHLHKHSEEKPYECLRCDYSCTYKASYVSHMKIHRKY